MRLKDGRDNRVADQQVCEAEGEHVERRGSRHQEACYLSKGQDR